MKLVNAAICWGLTSALVTTIGHAQTALTPLWQRQPQTEMRTVAVGALVLDATGWATRAEGPPSARVAVDPATGDAGDVGTAGIPLPVNGGSLLTEVRTSDICFNVCFVEQERVQRLAADGSPRWIRATPPGSLFGPSLHAGAVHEWPGLVVLGTGATVLALDADSGAIRWQYTSASGCSVRFAGGGELLRVWRNCNGESSLLALSTDGQVSWQQPLGRMITTAQALGSGTAVLGQTPTGLRWRVFDGSGLPVQSVELSTTEGVTGTLLSTGSSQSALLTSDRRLYLLDRFANTPLWSQAFDPAGLEQMQLLGHASAPQPQLLLWQRRSGQPASDHFLAVALADGSVRWQQPLAVGERWSATGLGEVPDPIPEALLLRTERGPSHDPEPRWLALDLLDGHVRWQRETVRVPVRQESVGFVAAERLHWVRHSRDDSTAALLVEVLDFSGQVVRSERVPLPVELFADREPVRLEATFNQDRIAVRVREAFVSAAEQWAVLDRQTLALIALPLGSVRLAADRGYYLASGCVQGICLGAEYFAGSGAPDWQLEAPPGFELRAVYHDGIVAARSEGAPALRFIAAADGQRFEWPTRARFDPVLRPASDRFLFPGADAALRLVSAGNGSLLAQVSAAPLEGIYTLDQPTAQIRAYGRGPGFSRSHQLLFDADLSRRALLSDELSEMTVDTLPPGADRASGWLQAAVRSGEPGRVEQLAVATDGSGQVFQRRSLRITPTGTDAHPGERALAVDATHLLLVQPATRSAYVPTDAFAGFAIPPLLRRADVGIFARLLDWQTVALDLRNQGPDATRAVLTTTRFGEGIRLTVIACSGVGSGCEPGAEPPAALDLAANGQATVVLRGSELMANYGQGHEVSFQLDADVATSDPQRQDNQAVVRLLAPLLVNGFE